MFFSNVPSTIVSNILNENSGQGQNHQMVTKFFDWINMECSRNNYRFCGIEKIPNDYIAFLITKYSQYCDTIDFNIRGYFCFHHVRRGILFNEYFADLTFEITDNRLLICDNYIKDPQNRGKGIGSFGLTYIKNIASILKCKEIYGKAQLPDSSDEKGLERLLTFYKKNGFIETDTKNHIVTYCCPQN